MWPSRRVLVKALVAVPVAGAVIKPWPVYAANDRIDVTRFSMEASSDGDGAVANADFSLILPQAVEDVISRGIQVSFLMELELTRPRWYWRDERILQAERTYKVAFNSLTRQYRLEFQNYRQHFPVLTDAILAMVRVRGWKFAERDRLKKGETYEGQIRFRLDLTQMPKPFQVNALTNRDWNLATEWKSAQFTL